MLKYYKVQKDINSGKLYLYTMNKKAQVSANLIFGVTILIAGMFFVLLWALGEATSQGVLLNIGRWGLGLLAIVIEIIQFIVKKGGN